MKDTEIILVVTFFELIIGWLQLQQQNSEETLFQTYPKTMSVGVNSLLITWFLYGFKLRIPRFYEAYLATVPLGVDFFGSLSMASALSFLLPDFVRPIVYFLGLLIPAGNIFCWIFQKLKAEFGETEFWKDNVDPALRNLTRMVNTGQQMGPTLPVTRQNSSPL